LINKLHKSKSVTPALVDEKGVLRVFTNTSNELLTFTSSADADIFISNKVFADELTMNRDVDLIYVPISFYSRNRVLFNKFFINQEIEDVYIDFILNNCQKSNLNRNASMSSFVSLPIIINSMDSDPKKFMEIFMDLEKSPDALAPCFSCGVPCFIADIKNLSKEQVAAALMTAADGSSFCPNCVIKKFTSSIKIRSKSKGFNMAAEVEALENLPELKTIADVESAFKFMEPIKVKFNSFKSVKQIQPWLN
jgi:hypothetical protein